MAIEAVVFDMDGVLIDSAAAHYDSWCRLAEELGRQVTPEQFAATFGRQNRDIIPLLFGPDPAPQRVEQLSERKEAIYRELVRGRLQAIEGAVELVRACHQAGFALAVGSSGHPLNIDLALSELRLTECFRVVVHGGDVLRGKPDPQVFLLAAERLGVSPSKCAVIEDAPSGIEAALRGGMAAIGLTSMHTAGALERAHLVVDSLRDLTPDAIGGLSPRGNAPGGSAAGA